MREEDNCFIPTPENTSTYKVTLKIKKPKIMKAAKEKIKGIFRKKAELEAEKIHFQGAMISLMAEEKEDTSWQSVIYRVPQGVMAWAVWRAPRVWQWPPQTTWPGGESRWTPSVQWTDALPGVLLAMS